jgi:threonine aldolase
MKENAPPQRENGQRATDVIGLRSDIIDQRSDIIDLRSDTVTKPTPAMRTAMASAEVGDDVYGEDPTVAGLERRAAEVFGREAAIFVPTGTMGNQIAIRLHTQHGQEVICETGSHIVEWEMAMLSAFSGCMPRTVAGEGGVLTWPQIQAAVSPSIYYRAQTGLISLENTHNMAGGTVTPLDVLEEIWTGAEAAGLPVHLDGARIFNAAIYLGISVAKLSRGFDTVMFSLSKGLCAPVGSMLVGTHKHIERARIFRKALGGGMRQVGILAAAGLVALDSMTARLAEDHANARLLAESLAQVPGVSLDLDGVQTNIVIFRLKDGKSAPEVVAGMKRRGVLAANFGPHAIRLVTHHDVDRSQCEEAAARIEDELSNT